MSAYNVSNNGVEHSVVLQLEPNDEEMIDVEAIANEPCRMTAYRKSRSLSDALKTIHRLRAQDQAAIFRKVANQSTIQGMSDTQELNEAKLINGLIYYLKRFKLRQQEEKDKFCSLLWGVCVVMA